MNQNYDSFTWKASIKHFLEHYQNDEINRICLPIELLIAKKEENLEKTNQQWLKKQIKEEIQIISVFASEVINLIDYQGNYLSKVQEIADLVEFYKQIAEDYTAFYGQKNIDPVLKSILAKSSVVSLFQKTYEELLKARARIKNLEKRANNTNSFIQKQRHDK